MGRIATLQNARDVGRGHGRAGGAGPAEARRRDERARARARARRRRARGSARARRRGGVARRRAARARATTPARAPPRRARARKRSGARREALQSERDSLAGRRASLEEMVATHSAFDEGVRALLRPAGSDSRCSASWPTRSRPAPTHERAVEAFLGDRLQAVLVPDAAQALVGIRWLQSLERRPRRLPAAGLGPHQERLRAAAADRAAGAEGARAAFGLLSGVGPARRAHPRLAARRDRGRDARGRARGRLAPRPAGRRHPRRRDAARRARRGRSRREGPARAAARGQGSGRAPGADRVTPRRPCAPRRPRRLARATGRRAEARALDERIHAAEKELVAVAPRARGRRRGARPTRLVSRRP